MRPKVTQSYTTRIRLLSWTGVIRTDQGERRRSLIEPLAASELTVKGAMASVFRERALDVSTVKIARTTVSANQCEGHLR